MTKQKITIVGGGYTGLLIGALVSQQGHIVNLYEAGNSLGGVLKDIVINEDWYYHGCQYLPSTDEWLQKLGLDKHLFSFPDQYASYTQLDEKHQAVLLDDFAQPVFNGRYEFSSVIPLSTNAKNYLDNYASIGKLIGQWASRLNIDDKLHTVSLDHMQIDRIYLPDMHNDLIIMKDNSTFYDKLLGIPRSLRDSSGNKKPQASLPINGFNDWLARLESIAKISGVIFHTNSPVTPYRYKGNVKFHVRKEDLTHDTIVWCASPTALIYNYCDHLLQAPAIKTSLVVGTLNGLGEISPKYWQIFDKSKKLLRFYVWQDKHRVAFTAEAARSSYEELQHEIKKIIEVILPSAKISFQGHVDENRWVNITEDDYNIITRNKNSMMKDGIIQGAWENYGRAAKIESITSSLKELNIL
jgi:hypothetical protein|tara:strand:- start:2783 stop:4018 length:1236 start_codon:yes stop_codon:yes gene_type:complete